jgi:hypothetical protein
VKTELYYFRKASRLPANVSINLPPAKNTNAETGFPGHMYL